MNLHNLTPAKGAIKSGKRLGRGESSGLGKTSGRGGKGQTARSGGKVRPGFEGGQMPLYRRIPKFGFKSRKQAFGSNQYDTINLKDLDKFEKGSLVDLETVRTVLGRKLKFGRVKLLADGEINKPVNIKLHAVSASAKEKIEAAGGSVELVSL
jgi:large subunit ribosomal protein L15